MTETQAVISQKKRFSMVWIVPIVAGLLGGWMAVHNFQTRGPLITIEFVSAEGIEAGKTHIKALSVDIGLVKSVMLNKKRDGVLVTAQIQKQSSDLLRDDSQFWVVRPRIGASGISGLSTLLSGAYIELSPGSGAPGHDHFKGLNEPPLTPANTPGLHVTLVGTDQTSLNSGEPVLYRGFEVGRVEKTAFDTTKRQVRFSLFINAPYDDLITENTRFWNASGIAVKMDAQGVRLNSESVESLLIGGVSFALPENLPPGGAVEDGQEFLLYPDKESINHTSYKHTADYLLLFDSSVRGLLPGAPVTYRGLEIGKVVGISFDYLPEENLYLDNDYKRVPVLIRLTPAALTGNDTPQTIAAMQQRLEDSIAKGLRATLKTGNLLTGSLYISLDFLDHPPQAELQHIAGYVVLPTLSGGFDQIQNKITQLLDTINNLPLKETVLSADNTLKSIGSAATQANQVLAELDQLLGNESTQNLPADLRNTLQNLRHNLSGLAGDFSSGSPFYRKLNGNLDQLQKTLHSVDQLSVQLATQPSELLFSDPLPEDPLAGDNL
ncbi:intermembrane transport protein PqiB [uncultured Desulfuromonas sp.]|uniref:intermembrane transport protein PqiB n=1 Tax=uncultured Desulfuromonas sp. TaxID=181013 RepID=UPI002AABDA84|nr:intermembrane transport protein PqiB [uncultured Desulfuromonas sp.]